MADERILAALVVILLFGGSFAMVEINDKLTTDNYRQLLEENPSVSVFLLKNVSGNVELLGRSEQSSAGFYRWKYVRDKTSIYFGTDLVDTAYWQVFNGTRQIRYFDVYEPELHVTESSASLTFLYYYYYDWTKKRQAGGLVRTVTLFPRTDDETIRWEPFDESQKFNFKWVHELDNTTFIEEAGIMANSKGVLIDYSGSRRQASSVSKSSKKLTIRYKAAAGTQTIDPIVGSWANATFYKGHAIRPDGSGTFDVAGKASFNYSQFSHLPWDYVYLNLSNKIGVKKEVTLSSDAYVGLLEQFNTTSQTWNVTNISGFFNGNLTTRGFTFSFLNAENRQFRILISNTLKDDGTYSWFLNTSILGTMYVLEFDPLLGGVNVAGQSKGSVAIVISPCCLAGSPINQINDENYVNNFQTGQNNQNPINIIINLSQPMAINKSNILLPNAAYEPTDYNISGNGNSSRGNYTDVELGNMTWVLLKSVVGGPDGSNITDDFVNNQSYNRYLLQITKWNNGDSAPAAPNGFAANEWSLYNTTNESGAAAAATSAPNATVAISNSTSANSTASLASEQLFSNVNFSDADLHQEVNSTFKWYTNNTNQSWGGGNRTAEMVPMIYKGAVGYWHLDENGGGTGYLDSSGNGNTGVPTRMINTTGIIAGAGSFNGSNFINVSNSKVFNLTKNITISAWIKPTGALSNFESQGIVVKTDQQYSLVYDGRNGEEWARFDINGGSAGESTKSAIRSVRGGVWTHVAATYDKATMRLYVNGVQVNYTLNSDGMGVDSSRAVTIGRRFDGTSNIQYFNGSIDEVAIYNRSLTASEVKQLYLRSWYDYSPQLFLLHPDNKLNASNLSDWNTTDMETYTSVSGAVLQPGKFVENMTVDANTTAYWRFDAGGSTTTANDSSNYGNSGTLRNGTRWVNDSAGGLSLNFDGVNDMVTVPDKDAFSFINSTGDTPFSLTAWVKRNPTPTGFRLIVGKMNTAANEEWVLQLNSNSSLSFNLMDASTAARATVVTAAVQNNTWFHVAATYDGRGGSNAAAGMSLFIDGVQPSVRNTTAVGYVAMENRPSNVVIGSEGLQAGGSFFNGTIDEVRIINRSLSAAEVLADYRKQAKGLGLLSNDYINYSSTGNFNEREGTVEFWIKPEWNGNDNIAHYIFDGNTLDQFSILKESSGRDNNLVVYAANPAAYLLDAKASNWLAGEWHHVAVTWNNYTSNTTLHVDGLQINNSGKAFVIPPQPNFILGARPDTKLSNCNCTFSEFRISRKALTAQEINLSFSKGRAYYQNEYLLNRSNYAKGDALVLEYTPTDSSATNGSKTNSSTLYVHNTVPSGAISFPTEGITTALNMLNATNLSDFDGDSLTCYWYNNGTFISATAASACNISYSASLGNNVINFSIYDGEAFSVNQSVSYDFDNRTNASINITLNNYFTNRTYEFGTTAEIVATFNSTGSGRTICIEINGTGYNSSGPINVSCGTETARYNITFNVLRLNKFNDSSTSVNVSPNNLFGINLDNRTFVQSVSLNLTGFGNPENVTISNSSSNVNRTWRIVLPGKLNGSRLITDNFLFNNLIYDKLNLSFLSSGIKTIYLNVSTALNDTNQNLTFTAAGYRVDEGNSLSLTENFNLSNNLSQAGTFVNITLNLNSSAPNATWENFETDFSSTNRWKSSNTGCTLQQHVRGYNAPNGAALTRMSCGGGGGTSLYLWTQEFDVRNVSSINISTFASCANGGRVKYGLYDGTSFYKYWDDNCDPGTSFTFNNLWFTLAKSASANTWSVSCVGCTGLQPDPTITPTLDSTKPWSLAFQVIDAGVMELYKIKLGGIMAARNGTNESFFKVFSSVTTKPIVLPNPIIAATLEATDYTVAYSGASINVTYELSNDNGTSFVTTTKGSRTVFATTGIGLVARINCTSSNSSQSCLITKIGLNVVPANLQNFSVDIGSDGTSDFYFSGNLTIANVTNRSNAVYNYVTNNCKSVPTCAVPIALTSSSGGIAEIKNMNLTRAGVRLFLNKSYADSFTNQTYLVNFTSGTVQFSNLAVDYRGTAELTVNARFSGDSTTLADFITKNVSIRYSPFRISLPINVSAWEVLIGSRTAKNVTPRGQGNTTPIFNVTSLAYDNVINVSLRLNISLNRTASDSINITHSLNGSKTSNWKINTTSQYLRNLSVNSSFGIWNWIDVNLTTGRFYLPQRIWTAICSECTRTFDYDNANTVVN